MSEELPNAADVSNIDTALFSYEQAKEMLLRSGELVEPGGSKFGLVLGGLVVGAGLGGALGFYLTRLKLETKYIKIAEDEIDGMRKHYRDKETALENTAAKPKLEELVREQGYSATEPPMAVTPPSSVVNAARDTTEDPRPEPQVREENVFDKPQVTPEEVGMPIVDNNWDYRKESARRSQHRPYVIHRDEKDENDEYDTVTYTYYETDDVLCNERDDVIGKDERDSLIGEANLNRFGHGSGDASTVYIRNDKLEMQMEVVRSPNSFAEEVHGFQHSESIARRHRRERRTPEDE
jgi:hypothetical protein